MMAKYTYTYFIEWVADTDGWGVCADFRFPDWERFPTRVYAANDKLIMEHIRKTLLGRCKAAEAARLKFPKRRNYSGCALPLNVAVQAITVDTEGE